MIRSAGRLGLAKASVVVLWQLRYTLLAVVIVSGPPAGPGFHSEPVRLRRAVCAGHRGLGFIGFRNTTAYNRWWEARTLWGGMIINSGRLTMA